MPFIEDERKKIGVNEEGFLIHPEDWNKDVAETLARKEEGIENLTADHWAVIHYIRSYYLEKNLAPMVRNLCKATGFTLKNIYGLFPSGPARGACKIAGLPKPDGCV